MRKRGGGLFPRCLFSSFFFRLSISLRNIDYFELSEGWLRGDKRSRSFGGVPRRGVPRRAAESGDCGRDVLIPECESSDAVRANPLTRAAGVAGRGRGVGDDSGKFFPARVGALPPPRSPRCSSYVSLPDIITRLMRLTKRALRYCVPAEQCVRLSRTHASGGGTDGASARRRPRPRPGAWPGWARPFGWSRRLDWPLSAPRGSA